MDSIQALAKRYAQAWYATYPNDIRTSDLEPLNRASTYLKENRRVVFFLRIPLIDMQQKKAGLEILIKGYQLPASLAHLVDLLAKKHRLFLFGATLKWIAVLFQRKNHITHFVYESVEPLSTQESAVLTQFLASKTQCDIIYDNKLNNGLIAGIRAQSSIWLWEHSLAQQLRRMRTAALQ